MLTRSLYKPLVTFSKNSTIALLKQPKPTDVTPSTPIENQVMLAAISCRINSWLSNSTFVMPQTTKGPQVVSVSTSFGVTFVKRTLTKIVGQIPGSEAPAFVTFSNSARIPVSLCGKRIAVYNGKLLMPILVKRSMLGFSFRQLVRCKRLGRIIHVKSEKNKRGGH